MYPLIEDAYTTAELEQLVTTLGVSGPGDRIRLAATLLLILRALECHRDVIAGPGGHGDRLDVIEAAIAGDEEG